jgi:hypothetical protein
VYWDNKGGGKEADRESDANLAGYTFYREGTPTPPDYETPEKGRGGRGLAAPVAEGSTAGGGTINSDRDLLPGPLEQNEMGNWSLADSNEMSPRTKKRVLWIIIAVGVFVLIGIAVGVGVGLGVGLQNGEGPMAEPAGESSRSVVHAGNSVVGQNLTHNSLIPGSGLDSSPAPTDPPSTNPDGTEAAADTTGSAGVPRPTYNSDCPALNNTVYHVPGSTKSFMRRCGIDYNSSGSTDLAHTWTISMADCMHSCASFDQCTACAWGYIPGDKGEKHRCYMKKDLKQSHAAASDWCFATLQ